MKRAHGPLLNAPADPARRRFVLATLVSLLAGRALTGCERPDPYAYAPGQPPQWLLSITGDRDAVLRIGKAFIKAHPAEQDPDAIFAAIERSLAGQDTADTAQMVAALQRVVPDDYRRGEVVSVDGWILSRTEARLYAAVALLEA